MIGRRIHAASIVAIGLALLAPPAVAAPAAPEKAAADIRARELFGKGDTAYAEGRYEEAHAAFVEAYELSGRPQLLFNISNTLERLGKYEEAVDALEKYLASGKVKDQEVVRKRLANLRKRVDEQKKAETHAREDEQRRRATETPAVAAPPPTPSPLPANAPEPSSEKPTPVLPIVLLATGGAALATGGVFGVLTLSARSDVDASCRSAASGRFCSSNASSAIDRDKTFGLVTDIALASGVVLGAAGLYLLLAGKGESASRGGARVEARPAGAGVEVVGVF
jgi:tetratricopeptide (TPR) repeat protein